MLPTPARLVPGLQRVVDRRRAQGRPTPRVAILGAGAGGLCAGARLKQAGIDSFTIFEKSDGVGGTWRHNRYPGAACDAPSHFYSFSFAPWSEWDRVFAEQPQILAYMEDVADRFGLRRHLRTHCAITEARFDDDEGVWRLRTEHGDDVEADIVISGLGQLDVPVVPDIPGREGFAGTQFHSARWDHAHDLTGRRVAVVGSAASAVQFVPRIARDAAELVVFQRSPNYVLPKPDFRYPDVLKAAFRRVPGLRRLHRAQLWALLETNWWSFKAGSLRGRMTLSWFEKFLASQVPDPDLRAKLMPDYEVGCKRILIQTDYLRTIARDDVTLVTGPIERVEPSGIVAGGEVHEVDTIVWATGFATTEFLRGLEVVGRKGEALADVWHDGAEAYRGIAVPGFPNFFLLYGPNTNLGHSSIIHMIECQVDLTMRLVQEWRVRGGAVWDVTPEALEADQAEVQAAMQDMVWATSCHSWYKTESGRVTNNWPGTTAGYWIRTHADDLSAFADLRA